MERLPRPSGLTLIAKNLRLSESEQQHFAHKTQAIKIVVGHYLNHGFTFCGKPCSITDLADFLRVSPTYIMKEMGRYTRTLASVTSPEAIQHTMQATLGMILQNAMKDRAIVQNQVNMLISQQNGEYVPFMTSEANKVLRTLLESNKAFIEFARMLQGPNQVNIQNNINKPTTVEGEAEVLTVTDAVKMLSEKNPLSLLENDEAKEQIRLAELDGFDKVEVVATKQRGFELQASFALGSAPKLPKRKGKHIDRNEDDGTIIDAITDVEFDEE